VYLCVLCWSEKRQRLFPHTTVTDSLLDVIYEVKSRMPYVETRCPFSVHLWPSNSNWTSFFCRSCPASLSCVKLDLLTVIIYWREETNICPCFPHFCPVWVKLGIRDLHIMFSIYGFREYKRREGRDFRMGLNERTCTDMPCNYMPFWK
jgi:hypothetical protein